MSNNDSLRISTAKYESGRLSFDMSEVLEHLTAEELNDLVNSLACQDTIIEEVSNQIINGWTTEGYRGGRIANAACDNGTPLDKAIDRIARASGDVANKRIDELIRQCKSHEEENARQHALRIKDRNDAEVAQRDRDYWKECAVDRDDAMKRLRELVTSLQGEIVSLVADLEAHKEMILP